MTDAYPEVSAVIPHTGKLVLLDRVLDFSANEITCDATIRSDNPYLSQGGTVGSWIALEYMSQAIAAHSGMEARERDELPRIGFLLGTRKFKNNSVRDFKIGQRLHVNARRVWQDGGMAICEASISDELSGAVLVQATISVFLPDSNEQLEAMRRE